MFFFLVRSGTSGTTLVYLYSECQFIDTVPLFQYGTLTLYYNHKVRYKRDSPFESLPILL
jgi:hypothetical protein